jgi:hypothetical protein
MDCRPAPSTPSIADQFGNGSEIGHVFNALIDPEIARIVERAFGAQSTTFSEALFKIEMLVTDMQARMNPFTQHARRENSPE